MSSGLDDSLVEKIQYSFGSVMSLRTRVNELEDAARIITNLAKESMEIANTAQKCADTAQRRAYLCGMMIGIDDVIDEEMNNYGDQEEEEFQYMNDEILNEEIGQSGPVDDEILNNGVSNDPEIEIVYERVKPSKKRVMDEAEIIIVNESIKKCRVS